MIEVNMYIKRAVILAGGMGTRIRTENEIRPKPMVLIGEMPILWHIMKNLHSQGIEEFIICLGYKGEQIKDFFESYASRVGDVIVDGKSQTIEYLNPGQEKWRVVLADTGLETLTGGRINRVKKYLNDSPFLCTYGDGLADIDLQDLFESHLAHKTIATLTAVHPSTRFGNLVIGKTGIVEDFSEKPPSDEWINGGFFIFEQSIFNYLDDHCILEREPLQNLTRDGQLGAYKHFGFWRPMDTYRESKELNELYAAQQAPWVNWQTE